MAADTHFSNVAYRTKMMLMVWVSLLWISDLPDILFYYLIGPVPTWLIYVKFGLMLLYTGICLIMKRYKPVLPYAFFMLVFIGGVMALDWVKVQDWWQDWLPRAETSFFWGYAKIYIRDIVLVLLVIIAMWLVKRKRASFFLTSGEWQAPIDPVRWLGIKSGESWRFFGWIFGLTAMLAVAIPTLLSMSITKEQLIRAIPLIPAALLFAGINAFNEEMYYRAPMLSTLPRLIGKQQAMLFNAIFFGMAHYLYGSPPGIIGAAMTGFLAWLICKSMLETKGLAWPWLIHFLPDAMIFFSYALLFVRG